MTNARSIVIPALVVLLLGAILYGATKNGNPNNNVVPVNFVELKQMESQISPRYFALVDPGNKTVSVIEIQVETGEQRVLSVTPYLKKSK